MTTSNFPGLGRYAQLGAVMAARTNNLAAQNQTQLGPTYMNPQIPVPDAPVQGPGDVGSDLMAGQAPENPQAPGEITLPPMPVSSMVRDTSPKPTMAGQMDAANRRYRGMA